MHTSRVDHSHRHHVQSCDCGQDFWLSKNGLDCLTTASFCPWPVDHRLTVHAQRLDHAFWLLAVLDIGPRTPLDRLTTPWEVPWPFDCILTVVTALDTAPMGVTPLDTLYMYRECTWNYPACMCRGKVICLFVCYHHENSQILTSRNLSNSWCNQSVEISEKLAWLCFESFCMGVPNVSKTHTNTIYLYIPLWYINMTLI